MWLAQRALPYTAVDVVLCPDAPFICPRPWAPFVCGLMVKYIQVGIYGGTTLLPISCIQAQYVADELLWGTVADSSVPCTPIIDR